MLVVSDIEDVFIPLQDGFLDYFRNVILELLDSLPRMFKETIRPESVYTSAVRGGLEALVRLSWHSFI